MISPGGGFPLAAVDRLAAEAVYRASPLRLALASTPAEREAVYRLRYRHVIRAGWARPQELPDGREQDRFDAKATHVVAWSGDTAVGTCRIVFPDPIRPLPPEAVFDIVIEPRGRAPTLDRLLVGAGHRGGGATAALLARAWQELRGRGFELVSGIATRPVVRLHRSMGFDVAVLAGPRLYWGEERYAILGAPSAALPTAYEVSEKHEEIPPEFTRILVEHGVDQPSITPGARLVEDLGLDSLEFVVTVLELEEYLGIELADELDGVRTVGEAVERVRLKTGSPQWTPAN
jgi:acyl carrier protein